MAVPGINVSVEAVLENQVQEVTLDGQEKYVQYALIFNIYYISLFLFYYRYVHICIFYTSIRL